MTPMSPAAQMITARDRQTYSPAQDVSEHTADLSQGRRCGQSRVNATTDSEPVTLRTSDHVLVSQGAPAA